MSTDRDIAHFNGIMEGIQPCFEGRERPLYPTVFIIGPPRSGTTLTHQVLAHSGCLGYISNFVARFWMAPAVGANIDVSMGICRDLDCNTFISEAGRTTGWAGPHEFGYFWDRWFDLGEGTHFLSDAGRKQIDISGLAKELASIENAYSKPMCYKNNTWCTFQADLLADLLPSSLFVVCRRDPLFIAQSLFEIRLKRSGDHARWWSVRPRRYGELIQLSSWEQVAIQALEIERDMDHVLRHIPLQRQIHVEYEEFCDNPRGLVDQVIEYLRPYGVKPHAKIDYPSLEATNYQRLPDDDWRKISEALERHRRQPQSRGA